MISHKQGGGRSPDQGMAQRQAPDRHDEVDGREQHHFPGHADPIEENSGELVQRVTLAQDGDAARADKLQHARNQGDDQQAEARGTGRRGRASRPTRESAAA